MHRLSVALVYALILCASALRAAGPVYVALWFDTEDYITPASDDAALRIATDLTKLGVKATFKVVGEKARMLEVRGRKDVLQALSKHSIGYHSNYHSVHPTPSEYLRYFGFLEGAEEFQRREQPGALDIRRVFGTQPSCYGQPGSSWGPQNNLALRRMRIPVYLDEGSQVGLDGQPFWYGGLLYVFNMGEQTFRARLDVGLKTRRICEIRQSCPQTSVAKRRPDQHLLSPERVREHRVLGRRELLAWSEPATRRVEAAACPDQRRCRALLPSPAQVRRAHEGLTRCEIRHAQGLSAHV